MNTQNRLQGETRTPAVAKSSLPSDSCKQGHSRSLVMTSKHYFACSCPSWVYRCLVPFSIFL